MVTLPGHFGSRPMKHVEGNKYVIWKKTPTTSLFFAHAGSECVCFAPKFLVARLEGVPDLSGEGWPHRSSTFYMWSLPPFPSYHNLLWSTRFIVVTLGGSVFISIIIIIVMTMVITITSISRITEFCDFDREIKITEFCDFDFVSWNACDIEVK